jgi:hypothetical protein
MWPYTGVPDSVDRYFAASPKAEIGQAIFGRLQTYRAARDGVRDRTLARAVAGYYGWDDGSGSTHTVSAGGKGGQLSILRVNKARAAAQSLVGLVCGPPLSWRPQAANTDAQSRSAVTLAAALLEYYWKREELEKRWREWVESAIVCGEANLFTEWDETKGPELPDGDGILRGGDVTFHVLRPWDVMRDESLRTADDSQWVAVRILKNRWDLIGMHPKDILGRPTEDIIRAMQPESTDVFGWTDDWRSRRKFATDHLPVFWFFHRPTPTLPEGREVMMTGPDCVLIDRPLTYPETPVYRLAAGELFDTPYAYSNWWDTLAPQEVIDGLETAIATNQLTLSVQSIAFEEGTTMAPDSVAGMQAYYYKRGSQPPQGIQLTQTPKEVFEHRNELMADQRDLVGLNDVVQGQPDTAQMNGAAFALLASMAIQRNSAFQKSSTSALGRSGLGLINLLEKKVDIPRKVAIVGKANKYLYESREFLGENLRPVDTLTVEIGNPVEQTVGGRMQLGETYVAQGWVTCPEELEQVHDTGRLDPILQGPRSSLLLVAAENQMLSEGRMPLVHGTQDHILHYKEHAFSLNANPDNQKNQNFVSIHQQHLDSHYREYWAVPDEVPLPEGDPLYHQRMRVMLGQLPPDQLGVPPPPSMNAPAPGGELGPPPQAPVQAQMPEPAANPISGAPVGPPLPEQGLPH